jgi:acetolactate synthase I/III small subunit
MSNQHTLIILMQDRPGVLNRVVSLLRRRNFKVASLAVGQSEQPGISRMTVVVEAEDVAQVANQLSRLIEVLTVSNVTSAPAVERELVLAQVHAPPATRADVITITSMIGARVVDVGASTVTLEMLGIPAQVEHFLAIVRPLGIKELTRSGRVVMARGGHSHLPPAEIGDLSGACTPTDAAVHEYALSVTQG